jgi:hypothetical protein
MSNITSNAHTFWINFRGTVQVLARVNLKIDSEYRLTPIEAAQDESGTYFARANIVGRDMVVFGPAGSLRDLKKEVIRWAGGEGAKWHFRAPGSFLPDALRGEIEILGITASRLAGETGVSDHVVRQWLAGRAEPTEEELQRLCAALGIFPGDIERR